MSARTFTTDEILRFLNKTSEGNRESAARYEASGNGFLRALFIEQAEYLEAAAREIAGKGTGDESGRGQPSVVSAGSLSGARAQRCPAAAGVHQRDRGRAVMARFRKKPVVIDALQWDGTLSSLHAIERAFPELRTVALTTHQRLPEYASGWRIGTLEGSHDVTPLDWIIKGVKGEFYPCKPDIFAATYEEVRDDA